MPLDHLLSVKRLCVCSVSVPSDVVNGVGDYFPDFYLNLLLPKFTIQVDEISKLFKYVESNNSYMCQHLDSNDWVCLDWSD